MLPVAVAFVARGSSGEQHSLRGLAERAVQELPRARRFCVAYVAFIPLNALNTVALETYDKCPHFTGEETEAGWLSGLPWVCTARKRWSQEDVCQSTLQLSNGVLGRWPWGGGVLGLPPTSSCVAPRKKCQLCPCPQVTAEEPGRARRVGALLIKSSKLLSPLPLKLWSPASSSGLPW